MIFFNAVIFMLCWNNFIVDLFNAPLMNFIQSLGILFMVDILGDLLK